MDRPEDRVALITQLDRDGRALRSVDVLAWPLTLGRGLDQQLVLNDISVAAHHATLALDDSGALVFTVGPSINGAWLNGQHLAAGASRVVPAQPSSLQLGHTKLLLRQRDEQLATERPLPAHLLRGAAARGWGGLQAHTHLWLVGALLMAALVLQQGLSLDPGADFTTWLPALVGLPPAVVAWCASWALLSKLFQQRFEFLAHLHIALPGLLLIQVLEALLPLLAASLGWPLLWRLTPVLRVLLMAGVVYRHLALLMPNQPQRAAAAIVTATAVGGAINLAFIHRSTDRLSAPAYMSSLPLPLLDTTRAAPSASLVQELAPLATRLQLRVQKARADDSAEGDDGD